MGDVISGLTPDQAALLSKLSQFDLAVSVGETNSGIRNIGSTSLTLVSQRIQFSYFRARRSFTCTALATYTLATAATLATQGFQAIYSVDPITGLLTLLASSANDTTLYSSSNARFANVLTSSVPIVSGNLYAAATLLVTAGTLPTIMAQSQAANTALGQSLQLAPRLSGHLTGQTSMPATATDASIAQTGSYVYTEVLI